MSFNIEVEGGKTVRLPTRGKYCDRDIVVTAEGGAEDLNDVLTEQETLIAELQAVLAEKASGGGSNAPTTISGVNLHDAAADTPNTYLQGETIKAYNGWTTTDFIRVEDGKFYLAYSTSVIDARYCSKFNENKGGAVALTGVINCTTKNRPIFLLGHNGYFRFSGNAEQITALEFYEVVNFNWEV